VGVTTNAHRVLVGKPEETAWKILGTGKDNIKMNLKERVWVVVELIHVARNRYMLRAVGNTVISLTVPQNAQNFLTR
jgi:chaperonin cofactor prefoldin